MRTIYKIIITIAAMGAFLLMSCMRDNRAESRQRVLVIHSWSDAAEDGKLFSLAMNKAFEQEGADVCIRHIYLDMVRSQGAITRGDIWPIYEDSIKKWHPDVILINDDPFLDQVLVEHISDSLFMNTPVVFAGINVLHRDSLYRFPLMTGFVDQIDFARNVELLMSITKQQALSVELDFTRHDEELRKMLFRAISDTTRFVNNYDFHLPSLNKEYLITHHPGQAVVSFISCAQPKRNNRISSNLSGKEILARYYMEAKTQWQLQVKRDIFSHNIIDRSRKPQFTCIREQFNNKKRVRFLCGYFTSTETQVNDQVKYAVKILNGSQPKTLPIGLHQQGYYMDYNAMTRFDPELEYDDYSDKFTIINAPFKYAHPTLFVLMIFVGFTLLCLTIAISVYVLLKWRKKGLTDLLDELLYEDMVNKLLFSKKSDTVWHLKGDKIYVTEEFAKTFNLPCTDLSIDQLKALVDQDSMWALNTILDYKNQRGKKAVRLCVVLNNGQNKFWVDALYKATDESAKKEELYGILVNADEKKATEDKLSEAQQKSSEVALKETFLANISHNLRTPLNAINGFSSLLTTDEVEINDEDRQSFSDIIHQNTSMILKMIDDIMEKSQIESGDIEIVKQKKSVTELIQECYMTNKVIAPTHLKFKMDNDYPDCHINIDVTRTKQIINNFLSNAFKFTIEGSVVVGWKDLKNEVEIYVEDTGIGVSEEKQKHLFDRFYKANENARGTGLGLDISKTIIDKQGGEIGVKSEKGKGSRFFIKTSKYITTMALVIVTMLGILPSCTTNDSSGNHNHKILVLYSYDREIRSYQLLNRCITKTLEDEDIKYDMQKAFLNLDNAKNSAEPMMTHFLDSLEQIGWRPDIVFAEGDRTASDLENYIDEIDALKNIPIVLGGLHHPNWDFIRSHNQIVPICEPIDYCKNINLAVGLTGINMVEIELDYFHQDSLIRNELKAAIARHPYIDNTDFHVFRLGEILPNKEQWVDSIIVTTISAESPERNVPAFSVKEDDDEYNIYTHLWKNPSLAVKRDIYSYDLIDKTTRPQFTAVKAGFGEMGERFLCGYFASYETVGTDIAKTGAQLLKGVDARIMTGLTHKQNYYMNYLAMEALGYKYRDYSDKFIIVGAPFHYEHPWLYALIIFIILLLLSAIIALATLIAAKWRESGQIKLMGSIMHKAEIRKLALRGASSHSVKNAEELLNIASHIHSTQSDISTDIKLSTDRIGQYTHEIYADIEEEGDYSWWQLRYVIMRDKKRQKRIDGILINIDDSKKYEEDLRTAIKLAEEAKKKEDFLKTISHEIRTPLNAVVGFSDILASSQTDSIPQDELEYLKSTINENNEKLKTMIEDVLLFSRVESGSITYSEDDINIADLTEEAWQEWLDKVSPNIDYSISNHLKGIYIKADRMKMRYILDQLISNSVKFTTEGSIHIGYRFNYATNDVTITVEDTGCGISKEKQRAAFNLFWKGDQFVPGLGLGLNIAQKLANGMGAKINVNSKEGFGSAFEVIITGEMRKE